MKLLQTLQFRLTVGDSQERLRMDLRFWLTKPRNWQKSQKIRYRNVRRDVTAWTGWQSSHHCHPVLTRQNRCFYKGQTLTWARIFVVNQNTINVLGYIERGQISLPDARPYNRNENILTNKEEIIIYTQNYRKNVHNATTITAGSANQCPNTLCIRLWIDVTFRALKNSYSQDSRVVHGMDLKKPIYMYK